MRLARFRLPTLLPIAAALCIALAAGCSHADTNSEGVPKKKAEQGSRLSQIAHRVEGDWEKLTADEKAFVTKELAYGNEANAKTLLYYASGKMRGKQGVSGQRPGGPPSGAMGTSNPR